MLFDLVVRNGFIVDGSGLPGRRADVGVIDGRIAALGRINRKAETEIDAEGMVVTPGFLDAHTHMDAQISWDPLGTSSCWHGVTTVVMGNCGFTLAPARNNQRQLVVRNLERAEDISAEAMALGIDWSWETYPDYLDAVDRLPKGINYAGYVGHSALRTWAMGERAFEGPATSDDLDVMAEQLRDSLQAGAVGFTTSMSPTHLTSDGRPVASRLASWSEIDFLVREMGRAGGGVFELSNADSGAMANDDATDEARQRAHYERLTKLAVESGVGVTFSVMTGRSNEHRMKLAVLDAAAARGGHMFGQAHSRALNIVVSFKTQTPFDLLPEWREWKAGSPEQKLHALRDPDQRLRMVESIRSAVWQKVRGPEARPPDYNNMLVMDGPLPPYRTVAEIAADRGVDPTDCMIDLALERDLDQFFLQPLLNVDQSAVLEIMRHPRCVVTFSDSGAHVTQILDSSIPTHLLGYWVREKQSIKLEEAVRMLTMVPSATWGFHDRGLLRIGMMADMCVFNPSTVSPGMPTVENDLPGGGPRLVQKATGIKATIVNGEVLTLNQEHTGKLPGKLLRSIRNS